MSGALRPVLPLPGPCHQDPTSQVYRIAQGAIGPDTGAGPAQKQAQIAVTAHQVAEAMLGHTLAGIPLGNWDQQVITWLADKDVSVIATVASLMHRCSTAGVQAGRREAVEEATRQAEADWAAEREEAWERSCALAADNRSMVEHLRSTIAALQDDLGERNTRVAELLGSRDAARREADDLRQDLAIDAAAVQRLRAEVNRRAVLAAALIGERDHYGQALDAIVAAVAVFEDRLCGRSLPDAATADLLAAVEAAIGGVR